jgi:hypothetical protein
LHIFLVAHCLIFSHNMPFRLGRGGMHMAGGGMHRGGGGGLDVHPVPVHPPSVRPCVRIRLRNRVTSMIQIRIKVMQIRNTG